MSPPVDDVSPEARRLEALNMTLTKIQNLLGVAVVFMIQKDRVSRDLLDYTTLAEEADDLGQAIKDHKNQGS